LETVCSHCGAKQLPRRVVFGTRTQEFTLTPEEEVDRPDDPDREHWQIPSDHRPTRYQAPDERALGREQIRRGGFFRRLLAFVIDIIVIAILAAIMFWLSYIGYSVGLSGYGRTVTWRNTAQLLVLATWGGIALASLYFVVFHGMDGKTIGKWLLGLRVVRADRTAIGYRQALLRWAAEVVFAPFVLGFLWVLWSHEKRAWHDHFAGTSVIRD
jgi:uncharacterized RDD family membrane protein YckC